MGLSKYLTNDRFLPFVCGVCMTLNFIVVWTIPIVGMGNLYKVLLKPYLQPAYQYLEQQPTLRKFASTYIYSKADHADFFALSLLLVINCSISLPIVFYWQFTYGHLPLWLVFLYYCSWVGIGGSMMGAAYAIAHKEGHNPRLYKKNLQAVVGNFFENGLGVFFGNVPHNFTTSHIKVHHATNGGIGDSFYLWDLDRSSFGDFMLYIHRVFLHMVGISSIRLLRAQGRIDKAQQLIKGVTIYLGVGVALLAASRSVSFVFFLYLQPLFCMTYFLALINVGFHGFLEYDAKGEHLPSVNSSTIVDGQDDVFGEDDHMAHHYNSGVYFKDLKEHQAGKVNEWKTARASVFHTLSIAELSIFIVLGLWEQLADHYVDYSGTMSRAEVIQLLQERARRTETSYEAYSRYLLDPSAEQRQALRAASNGMAAILYGGVGDEADGGQPRLPPVVTPSSKEREKGQGGAMGGGGKDKDKEGMKGEGTGSGNITASSSSGSLHSQGQGMTGTMTGAGAAAGAAGSGRDDE